MAWDAFHRRGEVLRAVLEHAETHRDGRLPMELVGVAETFRDDLDLLGALQLRWHTRLAGSIERELMGRPAELEDAVVAAWRRAATEMSGVRMILDSCAAQPSSEEMARLLDRAHRKDWTLMGAMAGTAGPGDAARAVAAGRALEQRARAGHRPPAAVSTSAAGRHALPAQRGERPSLLRRVRAHLAA